MHAEQKAVELDAPVRPLLLLASSLHDSVLAAESAQLTGGLPAVQSGVDPSLELGLSVPASPAGNRKLLEPGLKSELEPALESGLESGVKPGQAPMEDLLDLFADEDAIRSSDKKTKKRRRKKLLVGIIFVRTLSDRSTVALWYSHV